MAFAGRERKSGATDDNYNRTSHYLDRRARFNRADGDVTTQSSGHSGKTYRPDIDGLRAVAVLAVLLFHCQVPGVTGGFVGVDVFFVISGYVITKSLTYDLDNGQFSILRFYDRLVILIFPALIFTFAVCWIAAWLLFLPADFLDFSRSLIASAASLGNIYFWKYSGYFDAGAHLRPLLHTWSLSVEEQFYLIMPATLWLAHKYLNSRYILVFLLAAAASFALSIDALWVAPTANFFLLPTRAWELLIGCMLALRSVQLGTRSLREGAGLLGMALFGYAVFSYTEATPFPGPTALAPCLGAALIITAGESGTSSVSRLLSWKPIVAVGLISYSLYLFHWPIIAFVRYATLQDLTAPEIVVIIVTAFGLAGLSWKFIEQPVRNSTMGFKRGMPLIAGVSSVAVLMLVGLFGVVSDGAKSRFPEVVQEASVEQNIWRTGTCFLLNHDFRVWTFAACARTPPQPTKVLLWGDSFAAHYSAGLLADGHTLSAQFVQYTAAGCPPILSYYSYARPNCQAFNKNALNIIRDHHIEKVILSARWTEIRGRGFGGLKETIEALKAEGVEVWVIGQSPEFPAGVDLIAYRNRTKAEAGRAASWPISVDPNINARLRKATGGAHFIDPLARLCDQNECPYTDGSHLLYADYGHFSEYGSAQAVTAYFPFVRTTSAKNSADLQN